MRRFRNSGIALSETLTETELRMAELHLRFMSPVAPRSVTATEPSPQSPYDRGVEKTKKTVPEEWITHIGGANREPIGWIAPRDEGFVAIDLLGRERSETVGWLEAEEPLDDLGIRYLAAPYEFVTDSGTSKVYIAEATPDFVRVKEDDFNDINSNQTFHTLPFPVPEDLLRELPGR